MEAFTIKPADMKEKKIIADEGEIFSEPKSAVKISSKG